MACQDGVDQWAQTVGKQLPHLSKPHATVLALWSVGMVLARSCALSAVSLVLAASVVYRGCAIPVAWTMLPANQQHAWRGEWLGLLHRLWRSIPRGETVIGLADRGLYAPWLYRRIRRIGWHPFLRVNLGGTF
ncbi:MAG: hypothetical protein ACR2PL_08485 [Dehalococcoidia bacterium]